VPWEKVIVHDTPGCRATSHPNAAKVISTTSRTCGSDRSCASMLGVASRSPRFRGARHPGPFATRSGRLVRNGGRLNAMIDGADRKPASRSTTASCLQFVAISFCLFVRRRYWAMEKPFSDRLMRDDGGGHFRFGQHRCLGGPGNARLSKRYGRGRNSAPPTYELFKLLGYGRVRPRQPCSYLWGEKC